MKGYALVCSAMQTRYVLLGDVVGSREIDNRSAFGTTLSEACKTISKQYEHAFDAPLEPLKGVDEIGGVLTSADPLYDILDDIRIHIHPQELRVGVAIGRVDVGQDSGDVSQMDGPAFHRADELLDELEPSSLRVAFDLAESPLDTALADEINLVFLLKRRWTDRQRDVVRSSQHYDSQATVAQELGISQPAVSKALSRASWPELREIEGRIRSTLESL